MKHWGLLFLSLIIFSSCAREEKWVVYKDPKYPLSIKYLSKKMRVEPFFDAKEKSYWIDVDIDIGDEFPHREVAYEGLYDVIVYDPTHSFKGSQELNCGEVIFNGIPAIAIKNEKGKVYLYKLLIPNLYIEIWLSGVDIRQWNPKTITQKESDRVEQLTYEMIKHFKWEQKIDTSSEEFKAWKKHIWKILNGVRP